jgi:hypothetical protein
MIGDFNQSAKDWLADVLNNLGNCLTVGEDPCFIVKIDGVEIEIRLNTIPGQFNRQQLVNWENLGSEK